MTFNNGKSILATIERIAATASKNDKDTMVRAAGAASTLFVKVVTTAYNPFLNFGISFAPRKTEGIAPGTNGLEEPFVWKLIDDLAQRKLSGTSARDSLQNAIDLLDEDSAEVLRRIINKDMRAGFSDGTVTRVFKGCFPEFPYMRCSLPAKSNMPKWDWSVGIIVQEKADGMFANVNRDDAGLVWVTSRQGSRFPDGCLGIEENAIKVLLPDTQTHGELTVYEDGKLLPREKGNGVLNSLLSGGALESNQRVCFDAWDQIPRASVVSGGSYALPYKERLTGLIRQGIVANRSGIANIRVIDTKIVTSKAQAYDVYRAKLKLGKEGVICKHPKAIWKDTTSKDQVKLKLEFIVDLRIKGFIPGTPGTKHEFTFGSLLCESECGLLQVGVSGINDKLRAEIQANRPAWLESILAVKANEIMAPDESEELHSLFLPRFSEPRPDKTTADTLEQIKDIKQASMEAA